VVASYRRSVQSVSGSILSSMRSKIRARGTPNVDEPSHAPRTSHAKRPGTRRDPSSQPHAILFLYLRCIISSVFFISSIYKLAYVDVSRVRLALSAGAFSRSTQYSSLDGSTQEGDDAVEFWPGIPFAPRMDDALRLYLNLQPDAVASLRTYYPLVFVLGALLELVGAILFVANRKEGVRMLLIVLGVVTLVMHPMWDVGERFEAWKNMSLAGGLLMCELMMRSKNT
jgi:hypothetical protein